MHSGSLNFILRTIVNSASTALLFDCPFRCPKKKVRNEVEMLQAAKC